MHIHWQIERFDDGIDEDPAFSECMLEIEGSIECDGQTAGLLSANYLFAENPESNVAFMELWDLDATMCAVYEEIIHPHREEFRKPLPELLDAAPGFLCVHFIALRPQFRRRGLGLEVLREIVRAWADLRTGVVLLNAQPLQHLPHGYDDFDDEVRDLPWNPPDEDHARLVKHFGSWGMQHLSGTRFMVAAPEILCDTVTSVWPPCPLPDWSDE